MKYIIIIILTLVVSACTKAPDVTESETSEGLILSIEQQQKMGIRTDSLRKVEIPEYISVRGIVDVPPTQRASISVFHGGYVRYLDLLPGQEIKRGDLLFTLQSPEYINMQQAYLEVKERISFLAADYERQKALVSEAISSEKKFKQAESDYLVAKARLDGLREQLKLINISIVKLENGEVTNEINVYAPISGFVSDLAINKGIYLSPQDIALQIINTDHIHLELKVYEKDVMKIKVGQKIVFKVEESDTPLTGEVHLIEKSIDSQERAVQVHGHLPEVNANLVVGAFVEAKIEIGVFQRYALPLDAVVDMDGAKFIAVKSTQSENSFTKMQVKTGIQTKEWIEIVETIGLLDKQIVISGAYEVIN